MKRDELIEIMLFQLRNFNRTDCEVTTETVHNTIFSFDYYKTITTGEGGMILTDSDNLYRRADWYHDHGHDHNPNVTRAMEGRTLLGFNYRMNELQGALGLAQLRKLPIVIGEQKKNKEMLKEVLVKIKGVKFRDIPDPAGDTATFLAFNLPEAKMAENLQKALRG
jgi:8-amino-3,8-dideoxy-alpha-D-manno-octulosonate transaminase